MSTIKVNKIENPSTTDGGISIDNTGNLTVSRVTTDVNHATPLTLTRANQVGIHLNDTFGGSRFLGTSGGELYFGGSANHATNNTVWHAGNHGSESGLDADTVDGVEAASFLRSDTADSFDSTITGDTLILGGSALTSPSTAKLQVNGIMRTGAVYIHDTTNGTDAALSNVSNVLQWNGNEVWYSGKEIGRTTFNSGVKIKGTFNDTMTSTLVLEGGDPTIAFSDDGSNDDFYIHVNSNNFYILCDDDGVTGQWDGPHPLQLEADTNDGYMFGRRLIDNGNFSVNGSGFFETTLTVGGDVRIKNGANTDPGLCFTSDTDTGLFKNGNNSLGFTTGGVRRGYMQSGTFVFFGIYNNTVGSSGSTVRVTSDGRLRRASSSRRYKTNIEPMDVSYANRILDEVQPVWYRPLIPDPEYPQAYLDNLAEGESPTIDDCEAYCQDEGITWDADSKRMNEGENPAHSKWGFIAEDVAEIDPRLCSYNPHAGHYDSIQYEEFTPILLKIAQEQKVKIDSLEARLAALEAA